jgi:hypothetical protein
MQKITTTLSLGIPCCDICNSNLDHVKPATSYLRGIRHSKKHIPSRRSKFHVPTHANVNKVSGARAWRGKTDQTTAIGELLRAGRQLLARAEIRHKHGACDSSIWILGPAKCLICRGRAVKWDGIYLVRGIPTISGMKG